RYQVTVTEKRTILGIATTTRTVSRIVDGDDVRVPAIVHPAFRPPGAPKDEASLKTPLAPIPEEDEGEISAAPPVPKAAPAPDPTATTPTTASAKKSAFHDVVSTIGRTTALTDDEFRDLTEGHPGLFDFAKTGTDGLHATFSGLAESVRLATALVRAHA